MPMQPVQIANSGVTPGRYGNNKQIPVFNVDQRGRLTFAANVDIEPNLTVIADNETFNTKHINLNSDHLKLFSGDGIKIRLVNDDTFEFSINADKIEEMIENSMIPQGGTFMGNFVGNLTGNIKGDLHSSTIWVDDYIDIVGKDGTNPIIRRYQTEAGIHTKIYGLTNGGYSTGELTHISRGTTDSPQSVNPGDTLEAKIVLAHDGTNYVPVGFIGISADSAGSVGSGKVPGSIILGVFNEGNPEDISKSLYLDSRGYVGINNGINKPEATLDVNGFAKLATLTEPPASPTNGMIAIADGVSWNPAGTGKSSMVVYLGGNWQVAAVAP